MTPLVSIDHLSISYLQGPSLIPAVRDVSLTISKGETLALVGESGSGKSTLALALIGLLPKDQSRVTGSLQFEGREYAGATDEDWRALRGHRIGMVFQDPFSALNPVLTIGAQIEETVRLDARWNAENAARARARELVQHVQLGDADRILRSYPHQLSGGQRQRVVIAIAIARSPDLLIADEPTTALDVTIQDEIMKLLKRLQEELGMAMLFVTHNLPLIRQIAARTAVMYAGQIAEVGTTAAVLGAPQHPYTQGLLRSLPRLKPSGILPVLEGQPPEPAHLPAGCPFHPRCASRFEPCDKKEAAPRPAAQSTVRCHLYPET